MVSRILLKKYALYIEKEKNASPKNDHAMRKSPGHIVWVRALVLILCKEDPQSCTKTNLCINGIRQVVFERLALEYVFFYEILCTL
jgi:hypothetical protein